MNTNHLLIEALVRWSIEEKLRRNGSILYDPNLDVCSRAIDCGDYEPPTVPGFEFPQNRIVRVEPRMGDEK